MEQRVQPDGSAKRVVRTDAQILSILDEFDKSGFSVKDYCEVSDLSEAVLNAWIKKYRNKSEEDEKGFAKIDFIPTLVHAKPQLFAEIGNIKLYKEVSADYLKALLS